VAEYIFDSSVRFRDAQGNSQESDSIPVKIAIIPTDSGISSLPAGLPALAGCIIVGIILCITFLIYRRKRESR